MCTLSNVATYGDELFSPSVRFTPDTIPEAKSSKTGASVKYVHDENKNWYVFRTSYGRETRANEIIVNDGCFSYLPFHYVRKKVNGIIKNTKETLVPNILFAYLTEDKAYEYVNNNSLCSFLSFYYNHFEVKNGKNPPLIVPEKEMINFIKATCIESSHIMLVDPSRFRFKSNDHVEVLEGAFAGVRGKVIRYAGQQRVAVTIKGICTVATAYIPTAFLRIVTSE